MTQPDYTPPVFDFESVFEVDDYMHFYGDILTPERTQQQVEFLEEKLDMAPPMRVLDLACGFGRHANKLAERGYQVVGVDIMPGFLDLARAGAEDLGVQVDYRSGDMRSIRFEQEFDRALLLFTAFGYFEDEGNLEVLKTLSSALKPGGLLLFDVPNRDVMLSGFLPFIVTEKGEDLMIDRNTFDSLTGRMTNRRIVIRDGVRKDKPFFVRMYNPSELRDMLDEAGMEVVNMYGGYDDEPVSVESRRLVVIARKESS